MAIGVPVRIKVDAEKCEGHSRCYALAPELVDVDDLGNAFELVTYRTCQQVFLKAAPMQS